MTTNLPAYNIYQYYCSSEQAHIYDRRVGTASVPTVCKNEGGMITHLNIHKEILKKNGPLLRIAGTTISEISPNYIDFNSPFYSVSDHGNGISKVQLNVSDNISSSSNLWSSNKIVSYIATSAPTGSRFSALSGAEQTITSFSGATPVYTPVIFPTVTFQSSDFTIFNGTSVITVNNGGSFSFACSLNINNTVSANKAINIASRAMHNHGAGFDLVTDSVTLVTAVGPGSATNVFTLNHFNFIDTCPANSKFRVDMYSDISNASASNSSKLTANGGILRIVRI